MVGFTYRFWRILVEVVYQAVGEYGETYSKLYRSWYDLQGVLLADEWLAKEYNNGSVTIVEIEVL